jgi:hypothetical protein
MSCCEKIAKKLKGCFKIVSRKSSLKKGGGAFGFFCCTLRNKKTVCLLQENAIDLGLFEEERSEVEIGRLHQT